MGNDDRPHTELIWSWLKTPNPPGLLRFYPLGAPPVMEFYALTDNSLSIGRAESCQVRLMDDQVSRQHARVEPVSDGWRLEDCGSANGVFVDGKRVEQRLLRGEEVIRIGGSLLHFVTEGPASRNTRHLVHTGGLVGGPSLETARDLLQRASGSDLNVLINGEPGTGKETAARFVHFTSPRGAGPFVPVDCAAIAEELFERVLYGRDPGDSPDTAQDPRGLIPRADGGTLLLQEIGALTAACQPQLLAVLQERHVLPLGGASLVAVDFRAICVSSRDLGRQMSDGGFHPDLHARIAEVEVHLPPLRDRIEDLPLLAEHVLEERHGGVHSISVEALELLCQRPWPGNVSELQQAIADAIQRASDDLELKPEHFDADSAPEAEPAPVIRDTIEVQPAFLDGEKR